MKKSIKNFCGKFIKTPEKLDEFEEEFDDKLDLIRGIIKGEMQLKLIFLVSVILMGLYFYFTEQ